MKENVAFSEISFPLFGNEEAEETTEKFVGLLHTPGFTMLLVENMGSLVAQTTSNGVFQIWPLMVFCFLIALMAGMVMWFCVSC